MKIVGKVKVGGKKGTGIGFPTINLGISSVSEDIDYGIYAVIVEIKGVEYFGVMHHGNKFINSDNRDEIFCEIHILDFNENVYGEDVITQVLKKIRNVRQFKGEQELVDQITKDIEIAKNIFKNYVK
ncbi:riboflavin kinase [Patescibacteria group bacterium]|nr:riboflavin kinase [Patescibacteria group bacterium]